MSIRRLAVAALRLAPCAVFAWGSVTDASDAPVNAALKKIDHIVVIYGENRSFDNLYGLFPGANGIAQARQENTVQTDHDGTPLPHLPKVWNALPGMFPDQLPNRPFRIDAPPINLPLSTATPDLVHRFYQNKEQINGGKLDRYAAMSDAGALVMGYYDGSSLPLWKYAQEYVLADNFFMAAYGGSFLNHFWLACACTPYYLDGSQNRRAKLDEQGRLQRLPDSPASVLLGKVKLADGVLTPQGYAVNTMFPPYQPSKIVPAAGGDPRFADPAQHPLPPQTNDTIGDLLSSKSISWAWYAGSWNSALADGMQPPAAKRTIIYSGGTPNFQAHHQPYNYFARYAPGSQARAEHLKDGEDFFKAIEAGKLPQVAFYKPQGNLNQHPGYTDALTGDRHIADVVGKIQGSPQWARTLIIITYDENGGFWDHVPPPAGDEWGPGARVPAILISPHVKKGFVDSTPYDTTSILKLITRRFGLPALPGLRSTAGDLTGSLVLD